MQRKETSFRLYDLNRIYIYTFGNYHRIPIEVLLINSDTTAKENLTEKENSFFNRCVNWVFSTFNRKQDKSHIEMDKYSIIRSFDDISRNITMNYGKGNSVEDKIDHYIKSLEGDRYKKHGESYYICPLCGNSVTMKEWFCNIGESNFAECKYCRNEFRFGGTFRSDEQIVYVDELSANSEQLSYNVFAHKTHLLAKEKRGYVIELNLCNLIAVQFNSRWFITDIIYLIKALSHEEALKYKSINEE